MLSIFVIDLKQIDKMIGIYKITTKHNGKIYIGSSDNVEKRLKCHLSRLKRNVHHSVYLQAVYNKHGKENLEFSIIEVLSDNNDKIIKEQFWMDHFQSYNKDFGYNISKTASCNTTGEIKIYQYSVEGCYIKEWESIEKAKKALNLISIPAALSKKTTHKLSGGFQWKYYQKEKIESALKLYCCYDLKGMFVKSFHKVEEIKEFFKMKTISNILRCVKNNTTCCNHFWRIVNTYSFDKTIDVKDKNTRAKKIIQLDENNNVINTFNSLTEASKFIGVMVANLHRVVNSDDPKYKTCKSFIWKYL
jgi:group I intron endonuclease